MLDVTLAELLVYALLIDSVAFNLIAWFGRRWYIEHFSVLVKFFPPAKGWAAYYLILVLLIGYFAGAWPW